MSILLSSLNLIILCPLITDSGQEIQGIGSQENLGEIQKLIPLVLLSLCSAM